MQFLEVVREWFNRYLSTSEAIYLFLFFVVALVLLLWIGQYLAPVLTGLVFAYVLQGLVDRLEKWRFPHILSVFIAILLFVGGATALVLVVLPVVWSQFQEFIEQLPSLVDRFKALLSRLGEQYPTLIPEGMADQVLLQIRQSLTESSGTIIQTFVTQLPTLVALVIFLVLVPITLFFFLKDRNLLLDFFKKLLPENRPTMQRIGLEMNRQLASYIRGKFLEILIVGFVTYLVFTLLNLQYAALLALLVGLSVLIPFVGAAVVTIPVVAVAILQYGLTMEFLWIVIAYGAIQALDGNLLVPLLFAEAVHLHPIAIIAAVLVFGGLWGLWGVFFAIPLAVLIKAVVTAWPQQAEESVSSLQS